MKKLILLFALTLFLLIPALMAEDTIGCPKGIAKGVIWTRFTLKSFDFKEKWSSSQACMVDIDSGSQGIMAAKKTQFDFRLGYGLSNRINVAVNLKYEWSEMDKLMKKTMYNFDESALTQVWFSAQWIFLDKPDAGFFKHLKLSVGGSYGLPVKKDDQYLLSGLGPGVNQYKLGILCHTDLGESGIEFAAHLIHNGKGETKAVSGWGRSNMNIPDSLNYLTKLEYSFLDYFELGLGLSGWFNYSEDPVLKNSSTGETYKGYSHNLMIHPVFFPCTNQYEKRKLYAMFIIPLKERMMRTCSFKFTLGFMWTFYTE